MNAWAQGDWEGFCSLLEHGWPGEFTPGAANAYRVLLDGPDPDATVAALKRLLHAGQRFRPSAAELLEEVHRDPGQPTFDEAFALIFGPGGALHARPEQRTWAHQGERQRLFTAAIRERLAGMHPLVGAFGQRMGIDYLRELDINDPDYRELRRRDLRAAWDRHVEAFAHREVAALAAGEPRGELGLHRFDPLAALGVPAGAPRELEAGDDQ